ncbi:hypothetical protein ACSBR2_039822 [Camellia fascicularis]
MASRILVAMKTEMKQMRISDNVELPASFMDLLVKSEGSLVDPFQGNARSEENSEAVEPIDEEDQFEELEPQDIESKIKLTNAGPKLPKIVCMANLCVVGGYAVIFNHLSQLFYMHTENMLTWYTETTMWVPTVDMQISMLDMHIFKMDKDVNLNTAGSYKFSSVKTIHEYARDIWMIELVVLA